MKFSTLAGAFEALEGTASRVAMYGIVGELLAEAKDDEIRELAYLLEARLAPAFEGVETGVGERTAAAAIAAASGEELSAVDALSKRLGDMGLVAARLLPARRRATLSLDDVFRGLREVARAGGRGSTEKKQEGLTEILRRATPLEARYVVRLALGRLRLSLGTATIFEAIARTSDEPKRARAALERAYNLSSDLGRVLETYRLKGVGALERFKVRPGDPVRPMLCERMKTARDIFEKLGRCAAEEKLDGLRFQVHLKGGAVTIYSRNLENTTHSFPDVVEAVRTHFRAKSAIIDGEALVYDDETGEYRPFQVTVQRKRLHATEEATSELPLVLEAFDLLYVDGKDLTALPQHERRAELSRRIRPGGRIRLTPGIVAESAEELEAFFEEGIARGLEGTIVKRLDAPYTPAGRSYDWIKLKRNYRGELSDTIDLALVGYIRGRGARARLGIGSLLGAVYNAEADTFETAAKIGSGLSERAWVEVRELLDKEAADDRPARVDSRIAADVWVAPKYVVTVLADEITRSPVHTASRTAEGRGLALRFPRVVGGGLRDDKSAEDATTARELEELFTLQHAKRPK